MALDLFFPRRSVAAFVTAANDNKVGPRHVSDVLKYKDVDVTTIEPFLKSDNAWVRRCASQVIAVKGNRKLLIDAAKVEQDKSVLMTMIEGLVRQKEGLEDLIALLESEDQVIRAEMIQMFRRAGRAECLFGLAFSDDDALVSRVKKYMEEQDGKETDTSS